jgi:hypothetical protein
VERRRQRQMCIRDRYSAHQENHKRRIFRGGEDLEKRDDSIGFRTKV